MVNKINQTRAVLHQGRIVIAYSQGKGTNIACHWIIQSKRAIKFQFGSNPEFDLRPSADRIQSKHASGRYKNASAIQSTAPYAATDPADGTSTIKLSAQRPALR